MIKALKKGLVEVLVVVEDQWDPFMIIQPACSAKGQG
jgi:hypothetical protein